MLEKLPSDFCKQLEKYGLIKICAIMVWHSKMSSNDIKNVILFLLKVTWSLVDILQVMGATGVHNSASRIEVCVCCYNRSDGHSSSSFRVAYTIRSWEYLWSRKEVLTYRKENIWLWILDLLPHGLHFFPQIFLMLACWLLQPEPLRQVWGMAFEKSEGCHFLALHEHERSTREYFSRTGFASLLGRWELHVGVSNQALFPFCTVNFSTQA